MPKTENKTDDGDWPFVFVPPSFLKFSPFFNRVSNYDKYYPLGARSLGCCIVSIGFMVGWYFDNRNDEKLAIFRNKSKLFQRELKPDEDTVWK